MAPILTAVHSPDGIPSSQIVSYLFAEHEIRVSGGFGEELRDKISASATWVRQSLKPILTPF
jgi:hypothetical protein